MQTLLIAVVFALACATVRGDSYAVGGNDPVLWITIAENGSSLTAMQSSFPPGLETGYLIEPPEDMEEGSSYHVEFFIAIDTSIYHLKNQTVEDDLPKFDVPHANLHSCLSHIGFCTPMVSNTPGLATHSAALKGDFVPDEARGGDWVTAVFESELVLNAASYSVITHVRFYG